MSTRKKSFLGIGWSFPPTFDLNQKAVSMVSDVDDIYQSIGIILSTERGERVLNSSFGSDLSQLMFQSIDHTFEALVKDGIRDAIIYHEPRIDVNNIELIRKELEGLIEINVDFTVRSTNTRYNLVYPYYLNEATDI